MTEFAAVVLAHTDPSQLRRLVAALDDVPVFLHCDAKTPGPVFERMTQRLPRRVTLCPRVPTSLASWSLVQAELVALRAAISHTDAAHILVLSGADYPLTSMHELALELKNRRGKSWIWNVPIPFAGWDTRRHPDGGLWRFQHHFLTRHGHVLYCHGIPLRSPLRRHVPPELAVRAASQWKIYARHHAERLLDIVDTRHDLVRFWRSTLVPDESFAASVLASRSLVGTETLPECSTSAWYVQWPPDKPAYHPEYLQSKDFTTLAKLGSVAASGAPIDCEAASDPAPPYRRFFARKFSTDVDTDVLDRIDAELRSQ